MKNLLYLIISLLPIFASLTSFGSSSVDFLPVAFKGIKPLGRNVKRRKQHEKKPPQCCAHHILNVQLTSKYSKNKYRNFERIDLINVPKLVLNGFQSIFQPAVSNLATPGFGKSSFEFISLCAANIIDCSRFIIYLHQIR